MAARGVAAFKKKAAEKNAGSSRSSDVFAFQVKDGEEVTVRFLGLFRKPRSEKIIKAISEEGEDALEAFAEMYGARQLVDEKGNPKESLLEACVRRMKQEEPFCSGQHWIKGTSKVCAATVPTDDVAGCVYCWKKDNGDRSIRQARDVFGFTVFDYRKYHRVQREDDEKAQYRPCTEDEGRCKWCSKASDKGSVGHARVNGVRKWVVGKKWANAIVAQNDSLAKKCRSCAGKGKIRLEGYLCGNPACCEPLPDIDSNEMPVRCSSCGGKTYPVEHLACTKGCDNPVRASITDVDVNIIRAGSGKDDTVYSIVPQGFCDFPEEYHRFAYVIDWTQALKPESTSAQAAALGLSRDPFGKGKGRVGAEDYDDDEEEEEPKRKKGKRKPVDDDDDDDVIDD